MPAMKRTLVGLAVLSVVIAAIAWAGPPTATGVWLTNDVNYAFVNCSATGSSIQTLPNGKYLMRVMDNDVNAMIGVVYDAGTANYRPFANGFGMLISLYADDGGTPISCQSSDGGGDLYFTGTH
jgi:hypothetical protein